MASTVVPLFDVALQSWRLRASDLRHLPSFGIQAALIHWSSGGHHRSLKEEIERLRRWEIASFAAVGWAAEDSAVALERGMRTLPGLFVNPRVVAVGPVAVGRGSVGEFGLQRQIEIARDLQRPLLLEFHGHVSLREVRRVLALLREGELPAERALLLGLPRPAVQLAREVGHWVALTFAHRFSLSRGLVETVNRLGSERILLGSGGPDFLALPKAASLLEEAGVPRQVRKRLLSSNALGFLGIHELA